MAASDLLTYESEHDKETVPPLVPSARPDSRERNVEDFVAPEAPRPDLEQERAPAPSTVLPDELDFYESYAWCLNPHLTVREAIGHLRDEIRRLGVVPHGWQTGEVATNVVLLSSGVLNCVEDYLRGASLRLPWRLAAMRLGRGARWVTENVLGSLRRRPSAHVRRWREQWLARLNDFLAVVVAGQFSDVDSLVAAGGKLAALLESPLPSNLQSKRVGVPSPFRRLDLTQDDVLALGQRYVERFPDRAQAILIVGLRTSGCYFAPLLRALFEARGYEKVSLVTLVPGKGAGRWEGKELKRYAGRGYTALIVDDPPHTGGTILTAFEIARRAGFVPGKLRALVPAHPARRDWFKLLPDDFVVSLEPEQWRKRALMDPKEVQGRLADYYGHGNFVRTCVVASARAEELNTRLQNASSDERGARLKRIFEVHLETSEGQKETRYVLAKSVGWGWLGYHAFLAGHRLSGFVPPMLGLRDGILYMEWIAQPAPGNNSEQETEQRDTCASYVAARVRRLNLEARSITGADLQRQDNGIGLLAKALSKAYGAVVTDMLMQPRVARRLRQQPCPVPTLIDGNMQRAEWVAGPNGPLKTDYEHHGLGKEELNVIDPAFDLADTILNMGLSPENEDKLIRRYIEESGDIGVERRLFMNKLLAGLWAMKQAQEHLFGKAGLADRQQECHRRFMAAWDFLTVQAARHCGNYCRGPAQPHWRSPLVALDIDGVIDRRLFGFPCTTAAGIEALSLLKSHELSVTVNTARSVAEVKAYCEAYALAGGVAEHGSYLWDAVRQSGRTLISAEAARQLAELRRSLQGIPGVFLDDRHQYSIRAFTYRDKPLGLVATLVKAIRSLGVGDGALAPLPTLLVGHLMAELGLDKLCFHHTSIDTTVVAKETDKGTGLSALRDWVLGTDAETIAVGDQEPDLTAFRVATRSFAPANIGCAREARLLGCQIARHPYQRGLLEIARALTCPDGRRRDRHTESKMPSDHSSDLFSDVLRAADRNWTTNLMDALFDLGRFRIPGWQQH
jgi:hydroxymethylpyrimidine pyrophosphatase-like HAD family hydrolase